MHNAVRQLQVQDGPPATAMRDGLVYWQPRIAKPLPTRHTYGGKIGPDRTYHVIFVVARYTLVAAALPTETV